MYHPCDHPCWESKCKAVGNGQVAQVSTWTTFIWWIHFVWLNWTNFTRLIQFVVANQTNQNLTDTGLWSGLIHWKLAKNYELFNYWITHYFKNYTGILSKLWLNGSIKSTSRTLIQPKRCRSKCTGIKLAYIFGNLLSNLWVSQPRRQSYFG